MYLNKGTRVILFPPSDAFFFKQCGGKKVGIIARCMGPILGEFRTVLRLRTFKETTCEHLRIVLTCSALF
jgi:hypothetical protein